MFTKLEVSHPSTVTICVNKRSKDHTLYALNCYILLRSMRLGFILQAAPDHDSPEKGLSDPALLRVGIISQL